MNRTSTLSAGVLLFVLFFAGQANGQKNFLDAYIIKKNKDSLRGQIDYRDWGRTPAHIVFTAAGMAEPMTFGPDDLLAFGVNGERYESYTVHIYPYSNHPEQLTNEADLGNPCDTTVFLQVITTGKLTLWEFRHESDANYFFINGKDGRPSQLRLVTQVHSETNTFEQQELYKNQLSFLLRDCDAVIGRVARTNYEESSLRKLIFAYDNCGRDTVEHRSAGNKGGSMHFFPIVGFLTSKVKFTGAGDATTNQNFPASGSPVAGAGALFILPRNRQQLAFVVDAVWQEFHSVSNHSQDNSYINSVGHISYSQVKLDILFRYRYPAGKARPFFEFGIANGIALGLNAYESSHDIVGPYDYTTPMLGGGTRRYLQGWLLGAGVSAGRWTVEGRFERSPGISEVSAIGSATSNWYVLASFSL